MKKKILIIANNSGGLYSFRGMLLSELRKKGYKVYAITPFDDNISDLKKLGVRLINVPINRRGLNPFQDLKLILSYFRLIRTIKPDLVITYTIKPNIYAGSICRFLKINYAENITGLGTAFQHDGLMKKLVIHLYRFAMKKVRVVFFENIENQKIFIQHHIIPEKKSCLLNGAGVDVNKFNYLTYPSESNPIRFLFIGRVMEEKGINELFSAMKNLRRQNYNVFLDIVGEMEEDYEDIVRKYEKEGWLKYHGFQNDVRPFIGKALCFVLPSWHEGMANTNLECAASGRPVITSNIHGCKEAVIDGESGFLCKKQDADDLTCKMKAFVDLSYEKKESMGVSGREHTKKVFDKERVVSKTIHELEQYL